MKKLTGRKALSLLMAMMMLVSLMNLTALAAEEELPEEVTPLVNEEETEEELLLPMDEEEPVAVVAMIGDVVYGSLADAIAAAVDGDEILLLEDAAAGVATLDKALTINADGHTLGFKALALKAPLTVDNAVVKFAGNVVLSQDGQLDLVNGAKATFGAYMLTVGAGLQVNLVDSEMSFTGMSNYAVRGEKAGNGVLNLDGSTVTVDGKKAGKGGLYQMDVNMVDSAMTLKNIGNRASQDSSFFMEGSQLNVEKCTYGLVTVNALNVEAGSSLTISNMEYAGVTVAAKSELGVLVDSTSAMEVKGCGSSVKVEAGSLAYNAAVVNQAPAASCVFEDGAEVYIHDNNVRAFINTGYLELGEGSVLKNNGGNEVTAGGAVQNYGEGSMVLVKGGAVITGNKARLFGGGIANGLYYEKNGDVTRHPGSVRIEENAMVFGNTAEFDSQAYECGGDDLYNASTAEMYLASAPAMGEEMMVTGYYLDGSPAADYVRWDGEDEDALFTENEIDAEVGLKAAVSTLRTLTVRYLDADGVKVDDDTVTYHKDGDEYSVQPKDIDGFNRVYADGQFDAENGVMDADKLVVYVYSYRRNNNNNNTVPSEPAQEENNETEQPNEGNTVEVEEPEVPLRQTPIVDEDVPLANTPITDIDVPLGDVPETGDNTMLWEFMLIFSGIMLMGLGITGKKHDNI